MRKITKQAISAFNTDKNFRAGNTEVIANGAITTLHLHGNLIAERNKVNGKLKITAAGWLTNTTKERLNGLDGVRINQFKHQWYLNGELWNGSWKQIN